MKILITGAQFSNKGAQSMLFTVVNEIRNHYPNAEIYYLPLDYFKENCFMEMDKYRFHFVIDDKAGQDFPAKYGVLNYVVRWISMQKTLYNASRHGEVLILSKLWDKLDVLIDVSGYSLTSKFGISSINRVLRMIEASEMNGLKTILLPQSYGPFDFSEDICKRIGNALQGVNLLFAREEDGVEQLREKCGVKDKAILSPDIVLQSMEIEWENVFTKKPRFNYPILKTTDNVGIVPNSETVRNGQYNVVLDVYRTIFRELRSLGKEIYIFAHSNDLPLCRELFELVKDDVHCHLIENEIDCLSYGPFIRQFDFIVASRFHSIVHAYREDVPALILGWAVKYEALATLLRQGQYVFDITADQVDTALLKERLGTLASHATEESKSIRSYLETIRNNSCFDTCWRVLDSVS